MLVLQGFCFLQLWLAAWLIIGYYRGVWCSARDSYKKAIIGYIFIGGTAIRRTQHGSRAIGGLRRSMKYCQGATRPNRNIIKINRPKHVGIDIIYMSCYRNGGLIRRARHLPVVGGTQPYRCSHRGNCHAIAKTVGISWLDQAIVALVAWLKIAWKLAMGDGIDLWWWYQYRWCYQLDLV